MLTATGHFPGHDPDVSAMLGGITRKWPGSSRTPEWRALRSLLSSRLRQRGVPNRAAAPDPGARAVWGDLQSDVRGLLRACHCVPGQVWGANPRAWYPPALPRDPARPRPPAAVGHPPHPRPSHILLTFSVQGFSDILCTHIPWGSDENAGAESAPHGACESACLGGSQEMQVPQAHRGQLRSHPAFCPC